MRKLALSLVLLATSACAPSQTCKQITCAGSSRTYEFCRYNDGASYDFDGHVIACNVDNEDDTCSKAVSDYCATGKTP